MAELESVKIDIIVNELVNELQKAVAMRRQALRLINRIHEYMLALGLKEVCVDGVSLHRDNIFKAYKMSLDTLQEIHDKLGQIKYYKELLDAVDEHRIYMNPSTLEKAKLVKQHLDSLLESIKC